MLREYAAAAAWLASKQWVSPWACVRSQCCASSADVKEAGPHPGGRLLHEQLARSLTRRLCLAPQVPGGGAH